MANKGRNVEVSTFRVPTEYERQAAEARRRSAMAQMLAQQQYVPGESNVAPIPAAAPLVQGIQAFMLARQLKKSEEAAKAAEKAGRTEAVDYMRSFQPEQRTVSSAELAAIEAPTPMLDESGRITYSPASAVAAPNQKMVFDRTATGETDFSQPGQVQIGGPLSMAQKRARALEGLESTNPLVQQYALSQYEATQPKELDIKLADIDPSKVDMATVAEAQRTGNIGLIKALAEPKKEMSPYESAQIGLRERELDFKESRAGQASERPPPPKNYQYVDNTSTELEPIKGGPADPNRPMEMPTRARESIVEAQQRMREFASASQRTNEFINDIVNGKLPLYKGASVVYATERMLSPSDAIYDEENRPAFDRYYALERFVTEQVNRILSLAKGPQTDADALRAQKQILDNPNNKQVVLTALKTLDRLWKDESDFAEELINDWYSQYNQPVPLSREDQQALDWANKNPNDPRAAEIKQRLGR